MEVLSAGEALAGAVQEPGHAQGLQHQRQGQPHGDPAAAAHAALLEGERHG